MNLKSVFTSLAGAAVLALSMAAFAPTAARAQIEVDIDKGAVKPLPVAIPAFSGRRARGRHLAGHQRQSRALGAVPAAERPMSPTS
jgi:Tol biopolymer transport system component